MPFKSLKEKELKNSISMSAQLDVLMTKLKERLKQVIDVQVFQVISILVNTKNDNTDNC